MTAANGEPTGDDGPRHAIVLESAGKRYRQYEEESLLVKRLLQPHRRRTAQDLWALKDVSFTAERGETLGIIGRNGSGKTTLLRLLSGVSAPTEGRVRVNGRVAPLIGIGVGFNSELTGRENVFVNGRLLGMTRAQVAERFDDIVAFSEIESFIDTPVKFYSSGMFLRLAFAVAIHTEPDIFVLDEILAVGDLAFQLKCNDRMRDIQERGTTIVVVTHNLQMLSRLAPRAIVLDHGRVVFDGDVDAALGAYHEVMQRDEESRGSKVEALLEEGTQPRFGGGAAVTVQLGDADGPTRHFATGGTIQVRIRAEFDREVTDPLVGLLVSLPGQAAVFTMQTQPGEYAGRHGPDRPLDATISLTNRLLAGTYSVRAGIYDGDGEVMLGTSEPELCYVVATSRGHGVVDLEPRVQIDGRRVHLAANRRLEKPDADR